MDAFAALKTQVQAASANGADPSKLIGFFAQEMQLFFQHVQNAVATYSSTGELPHSLFSNKQVGKAIGEKKVKKPRKPSAFNLFMKTKLAEYKRLDVGNTPGAEPRDVSQARFKMAAAEWKALPDAEKAKLQAAAAAAAPELAGTAAAIVGAGQASSDDDEEDEDSSESSDSSEDEEVEIHQPPPPSSSKKRSKHG